MSHPSRAGLSHHAGIAHLTLFDELFAMILASQE